MPYDNYNNYNYHLLYFHIKWSIRAGIKGIKEIINKRNKNTEINTLLMCGGDVNVISK